VTAARIRYRFAGFEVSPARRALLREGREVPLIPRYFDLLVLLLERRREAVHRREIFDRVWSDVVVSDGALSQAVRNLRRALGDDSREPVFIRTVSRHGYRFTYAEVIEEPDADGAGSAPPRPPVPAPAVEDAPGDPFEAALARLLARETPEAPRSRSDRAKGGTPEFTSGVPDDEDGSSRREAAEALHALGTAEALRRLEADPRPGRALARALLRDTRWDVPGAGAVPLLGAPGGIPAGLRLVGLRLHRALRVAGLRLTAAAGGGALAGIVAGTVGGLVLFYAPGSVAPPTIVVALALIGAIVGGLGAAGVGAGLAAAEALARSRRGPALIALGAVGGGVLGWAAGLVGRWTLEGLFGHVLPDVGGGFEGLGLGAAAGLGYALATPRPEGGMAAPRGSERFRVALVTGLACAVAGVVLTALGADLAGVSLNALARSFQGSQVQLAPLARLLGEPELGDVTRSVLAAWEGMFFGAGLAWGLTRRPR
jgi:DNA-binding winged helix-turn-helix (wHTH) protein